MKTKIKGKHIGIAILIIISTSICVLTIAILRLLFFSGSVDATNLTYDYEEFKTIYEEYPNDNDMPLGLYLVSAVCEIENDGTTYNFVIRLKNITDSDELLTFNIYFGDEYLDYYDTSTTNPFYSVDALDYLYLPADTEIAFDYRSVIIGSDEESVEIFKEKFSDIYLEVMLGDYIGRIKIPVTYAWFFIKIWESSMKTSGQ